MRRKPAFTLVELLVVIGIIALLVGILLPVLAGARRQANAVKCATQLREIGNCFKLYEVEYRGWWPVARINGYGPQYPGGSHIGYNIDGVMYQGGGNQAYWFTFLRKYATKHKVGNAVGTADEGLLSRRTIFFGCPSWEGYRDAGVVVGDTALLQPGFGMNPYPTFTDRYPPAPTVYPPSAQWAVVGPFDSPRTLGTFYRAKAWTRPAERMLVADSRFWLAQSGRPPASGPYPPAVVAQPILANSGAGYGNDSVQSLIDMYRHGKTPPRQGNNYDPRGGKISYNILYCDGHVATATDGKEAYRSIRMKFPG
jgi:prepilin-type N-terminal cleavage/methylation domain-containing protein/prepilin-type processing-associated H-X9-DG protein